MLYSLSFSIHLKLTIGYSLLQKKASNVDSTIGFFPNITNNGPTTTHLPNTPPKERQSPRTRHQHKPQSTHLLDSGRHQLDTDPVAKETSQSESRRPGFSKLDSNKRLHAYRSLPHPTSPGHLNNDEQHLKLEERATWCNF